MPVYEYMCEKCKKVTESLRRMSDADEAITCEHCGCDKTNRTQSVFAMQAGGSQAPMGGGGPCGCGAKHSCGMG